MTSGNTNFSRVMILTAALACGSSVTLAGAAPEQLSGQVPAGSAQELPKARGPAERIPIALYEFRSDLPEVAARGSTDMFLTALVRSGQFRVVERARVSEGVAREKELNASGLTSGQSAQTKLHPARYLLEGAITEASAGEVQHSGTIGVGGLQVGHGSTRDTIGIDLRIVDAESGDIIDVISVSKPIHSESLSVSGVDSLVSGMLAKRGISSPFVPSAQITHDRKESVDTALRAVIDEAVAELAKRLTS